MTLRNYFILSIATAGIFALNLAHANSEPNSAYGCTPMVFDASVTWYDNSTLGLSACHYSDPTLPDGTTEVGGTVEANQYYSAVATYLYGDDLCGACAQITDVSTGPGNGKKVTVMITDECPAATNAEWCSSATDPNGQSGNYHLDLSEHAFTQLESSATGDFKVQWNVVPCPLSYLNVKAQNGANLTYMFQDGSSEYYASIVIRDYIMPIANVSFCTGSGTGCSAAAWQEGSNCWLGSGTWAGDFYLQITDKRGNVQNFGPVNVASGPTDPTSGGGVDTSSAYYANLGGSQFPACVVGTSTDTPPPTGTFTPTPNWTHTPTPTLTPLPADCPLMFNNCDSLTANGTWSGADATRTLNTSLPAAITQGTGSIEFQITTPLAFNDQMAHLTGFTPTVWSGFTRMTMDVYVDPGNLPWTAASTYQQITLYGAASGVAQYEQIIVAANQTIVAGMNHLNFTLDFPGGADISSTDTLTDFWIVLNVNDQQDGNIYVDNIVLHTDAACPPPSPTDTATSTSTSSPTLTHTRTVTPSSTPTPTFSDTVTLSATRTISPTPSNTVAMTSTFSDTPSSSVTETGTKTPSASNTPSGTPSMSSTVSATRTVSATFTVTDTPLPGSPTFSMTNTPYLSFTATPTLSRTGTATSTPTPSVSSTGTPLPGSPTFTTTVTPVISPTDSPTPSFSPTVTSFLSPTLSSTPSLTLTISPSLTATPSFSPSPTSSATRTSSPSLTTTPSFSASPSPSNTLPPSATCTPTLTATVTSTFTRTPTPLPAPAPIIHGLNISSGPLSGGTAVKINGANFVNGATVSLGGIAALNVRWVSATEITFTTPAGSAGAVTLVVTNPDTQSATLTSAFTYKLATPVPSSTGPNVIDQHLVFPNPNPGFGSIAVKLEGSVDSVELRVYSRSMICVGVTNSGPQSAGWCKVPLPSGLSSLGNGVYFYRVKSIRDNVENNEPGIGSFMIIR